jgi:hypothetical protein
MSFAARMKCSEVRRTDHAEYVTMNAVYSPDHTDPNYSWSQATPSGKIELTVSNKKLWGTINPGDVFQMEFHKV